MRKPACDLESGDILQLINGTVEVSWVARDASISNVTAPHVRVMTGDATYGDLIIPDYLEVEVIEFGEKK